MWLDGNESEDLLLKLQYCQSLKILDIALKSLSQILPRGWDKSSADTRSPLEVFLDSALRYGEMWKDDGGAECEEEQNPEDVWLTAFPPSS